MVDAKVISFLKEWVTRYLKNKDIITKKIQSIEDFDDGFDVIKKDKEQRFFVKPFLVDYEDTLQKIRNYAHSKVIICLNTKENFEEFINKWDRFVDAGRDLSVYFVNPFSKTEKVWIINPHTHALISDEQTLKQGLKTMAETVEFTTEEEVRKIINS